MEWTIPCDEKVSVTIIATGFKITPDTGFEMDEPIRHVLDPEEKKETPVAQKMDDPMGSSDEVEPYLKEVKTSTSEPVAEEKPAEEVQRFNLFEEEPVGEVQNEEKEVEETPTAETVEDLLRRMSQEI